MLIGRMFKRLTSGQTNAILSSIRHEAVVECRRVSVIVAVQLVLIYKLRLDWIYNLPNILLDFTIQKCFFTMAGVETQRLISVSLGKIAQSRSQRGGINLHKNLLVASVLNKARTAFMIDYNHFSQQKQLQAPVLTPKIASPSVPVSSNDQVNSSFTPPSANDPKPCQATPDSETGSTIVDTHDSSRLDSPPTEHQCLEQSVIPDKENVSPSTDNVHNCEPLEVCKQTSVSLDQHLEAANSLSQNAQNDASSSISSSYQLQTSASTTCPGILKRRRDNLNTVSSETECPANKRARTFSESSSCSFLQSSEISSSCEYDSDYDSCAMQTSDSPQISNLVSIFNSGFSGLCPSSSSSPSSVLYDCGYQSDNSSVNQWSGSRTVSDNQSLHCSSLVGRIGPISSAIVLSA